MTPNKPTPIDARRLADGARALNLPDPRTAEEARQQLEQTDDAIRAMQSLDDLGEEANAKAWRDMLTLQTRYSALQNRVAMFDAFALLAAAPTPIEEDRPPCDSAGRKIYIGDTVLWRGEFYTIRAFGPATGRCETREIYFEEPLHVEGEIPDEIGVDLVPVERKE